MIIDENMMLQLVWNLPQHYSTKNGVKTPYGQIVKHIKIEKILKEIEPFSDFSKRKNAIKRFNHSQETDGSPFRKGLALMPAKFGISFNKVTLNQAFNK